MSFLCSRSPELVVRQIQNGNARATKALGDWMATSKKAVKCRSRLVEAGVVEVLLGFLDQCSEKTFDQVRNGGDVDSPADWMLALMNIVHPEHLPMPQLEETRLSIARRIQPLARCMADSKQEFFLDEEHWMPCSVPYLGLLEHVMVLSPSAAKVVLEEPSTVNYVVQALFWRKLRPDIVELIPTERIFVDIQESASNLINLACWHVEQECLSVSSGRAFTDEGVKRLRRLAFVSAVSATYRDGTANEDATTLASGLLDMVKTAGTRNIRRALFYVLSRLSLAGCLEDQRAVVVNVVQFGLMSPSTEWTRSAPEFVAALTGLLTIPNTDGSVPAMDDRLFAVAIGSGLLEMCLNMQDDLEFEEGDELKELLRFSGMVAVGRKSGKAIRLRASVIREAANPEVSSEFASMVQAIVDKAVLADCASAECCLITCDWCHVAIEATKAKKCAGCQRENYCSKECQSKQWKEGGHKRVCRRKQVQLAETEASGSDSVAAIKHANRISENVNMAGVTLFDQRLHDILLQAAVRGNEIIDRVVVIDFRETPIAIDTKQVADFLEVCKEHLEEENGVDFIKRLIDRNRRSDSLTVVYIVPAIGTSDSSEEAHTVSDYRTVPFSADALSNGNLAAAGVTSWSEMQQRVVDDMDVSLDEIRNDPRRLQELTNRLSQRPPSEAEEVSDEAS